MEENNLNDEPKYSHEDFLSTMLFFLRTPAVYIDGFSKILAEGSDGSLNPKQTSSLEAIRRNSRDLLFLMDVFSDVLRFDRDWWGKVYRQSLKTEDLLQIVDESLGIAPSFGTLQIDPGIDISKELHGNLPLIQTNKEVLIPTIRLMVMSAIFTLPSCSKILIKAEASADWIDIYVVSNLNEIRHRFDDLQPKYSFSNIYNAIDIEFREAQEKRGAHDFYPILLAIVHGLSAIHNAEFRIKLSEASSNLVMRLPIKAG